MKYRHEWKHEISFGDLLILRQRLSAVVKKDAYSRNGIYQIRSLYFDNICDKALREKKDGVNIREKFRLRSYNRDISVIFLEKKRKINRLSCKERSRISLEQARAIISGDYGWMPESGIPLTAELYSKIKSQGLRPKTIVEYTREPFVFPPGNVRITLDYDIRTGLGSTDFLNPGCITIPAGEAPMILEVKWDEYLPDIIRDAVMLPGRREGAFSKYAACRVYG